MTRDMCKVLRDYVTQYLLSNTTVLAPAPESAAAERKEALDAMERENPGTVASGSLEPNVAAMVKD